MRFSTLYKASKPYHMLIVLLCAIVSGILTGYFFKEKALVLKPLGDIFLELILLFLTPLIFFNISAAIAALTNIKRMWRIMLTMLSVFLFTSSIASIYMLTVVNLFPLTQQVNLNLPHYIQPAAYQISAPILHFLKSPNYHQLFSRDNSLLLIIFSVLTGLFTAIFNKKTQVFNRFLQSGAVLFMKIFSYIMYYAPIGFFAYFAVLTAQIGPQILKNYYQTTLIYYVAAIIYFTLFLSLYAYLAGRKTSLLTFWKNCLIPATTALATCSSAASIPANLDAAKKSKIPAEIYDLVIPIGTIIHKDGSVLGGVLKIAFLFGIYHISLTTPSLILITFIVSLLVGTVMGAIPSGGMVGEALILSVFSFPPETLLLIAAISLIIDPIATMVNVTSNTVCCTLITQLTSHRKK